MTNTIEFFKNALHVAADIATETIWPTRCAICDAPGMLICEHCLKKLPYIDTYLACPICGAPYGRTQCTECTPLMLASANRESVPFNNMAYAMVADNAVKRIVKTYKDKGERRLAYTIANIASRYISPDWKNDCVITYIPDTIKARQRRGFDHAQELACTLANVAKLDCVGVFMPPKSIDQRNLSRKERFANMSSAIKLAPASPTFRKVIVFDDICTTGSTLYAAADCLRRAGYKEIYALAFGRVLD
ncbi:phosphoribosyltransferase family protein [Adlercreutzia sp. ZJ304]|uniref:ComF family protein n=1 Tax=Adlercreutzia sp. ZJ304 TaxID=2709791 RepID=UPI0013EB8173|nr:phosphoribosyltransferase family protein [Adlercreutzia sp. ZJ304]